MFSITYFALTRRLVYIRHRTVCMCKTIYQYRADCKVEICMQSEINNFVYSSYVNGPWLFQQLRRKTLKCTDFFL